MDGDAVAVPHKNPAAADAYLFPAQFDDLRSGEFWATSSNSHGTGAAGSQLFGYDMVVGAWDHDRGLQPAASGAGRHAERGLPSVGQEAPRGRGRDGGAFIDGVGADHFPGTGNEAGPWQEPPWDDQTKAWDDHAGAGNHFYIQHGDEVVLYAHMQEGTLTRSS